MGIGKSSLEINGIGRFDRAIGRKLDRRTLHKSACSHDDIAVITRHCPGFRRHIAVHGSSRLNALAELDDALGLSEGNGLNDIVTALGAVGNHWET